MEGISANFHGALVQDKSLDPSIAVLPTQAAKSHGINTGDIFLLENPATDTILPLEAELQDDQPTDTIRISTLAALNLRAKPRSSGNVHRLSEARTADVVVLKVVTESATNLGTRPATELVESYFNQRKRPVGVGDMITIPVPGSADNANAVEFHVAMVEPSFYSVIPSSSVVIVDGCSIDRYNAHAWMDRRARMARDAGAGPTAAGAWVNPAAGEKARIGKKHHDKEHGAEKASASASADSVKSGESQGSASDGVASGHGAVAGLEPSISICRDYYYEAHAKKVLQHPDGAAGVPKTKTARNAFKNFFRPRTLDAVGADGIWVVK